MDTNTIDQSLVYGILNVNGQEISQDSLLKEDLGLDSISLVQMLTEICSEFEIDLISISDADLLGLEKVEDVFNLIRKKNPDFV